MHRYIVDGVKGHDDETRDYDDDDMVEACMPLTDRVGHVGIALLAF